MPSQRSEKDACDLLDADHKAVKKLFNSYDELAGSKARGATTATYGINAFPTQVLIDKDGKVVGRAREGQVEELIKGLTSK